MRVEYDVKVPHNTYGNSPYADVFWEFYDSDHVSIKVEYKTTEQATKCQKALGMLMSRNRIFDIIMTRRKNVVYMMRSGACEQGK